jgi:hypothetical protein
LRCSAPHDRQQNQRGFLTVKPHKKRRQKLTPSKAHAKAARAEQRASAFDVKARDRHHLWTTRAIGHDPVDAVPFRSRIANLTNELDEIYAAKRVADVANNNSSPAGKQGSSNREDGDAPAEIHREL